MGQVLASQGPSASPFAVVRQTVVFAAPAAWINPVSCLGSAPGYASVHKIPVLEVTPSSSERANYAVFLSELCDLIDVPRPDPSTSDEDANTYVIAKAVVFKELDGSSTTNFIDLYKRNCFVLCSASTTLSDRVASNKNVTGKSTSI